MMADLRAVIALLGERHGIGLATSPRTAVSRRPETIPDPVSPVFISKIVRRTDPNRSKQGSDL